MSVAVPAPGRRPRPVAGLPEPAAEAVAKAWLLELLHATDLQDITAVPVDLLAREAPALCGLVVEAMSSDAALARLLPGGADAALAARAGVLSGAAGPVAVVAGVEALRAVLHRALRTSEDAGLAWDTGDRLAHVCANLTAASLPAATGAGTARATGTDPGPVVDRVAGPARRPPRPGPVRHDDPGAFGSPAPTVVAHDLRADSAPLGALGRVLAGRGTRPVALLAVELDDRERLGAIEGQAELARSLAPVEEALAALGGPDGVLVPEEPGRWWLVAPARDTDAARDLAARCSATVAQRAPERHGTRLRASIGVAVCPDDGTDASALVHHADQGVFTARALGVPVA